MPSIDLHIHTTATPHHSSWTPEVLVEAALRQGLLAIAATDHNTTASVRALREVGQRRGLHTLSGVELDSCFGGKLWHTLVYGADPAAPELLALCDAVFMSNAADAQALLEALPRYGLRLDPLTDLGRPPNVADVAASLARNNQLPGREPGDDDEGAGMRYLLTQVPGGYNPLDVADIIAVAHRLGGVAVLAHPGRSKGVYAVPATADDVAALASTGLDGVEVYYPTHTPEQQALYASLAKQHGLLVSGGSDSHHPRQPLAEVDAGLCAAFLSRMGIT